MCVLHQCAATLITLNDILMSIGGVYYVNVQQHWSPWMTSWCLLEVCTTSMCSNIDHLEWDHDVYWRFVLHQCAVTLINFNDILMSIGGVYYINVQQRLSPWMTSWCLLEVCTTSMCSNSDHLEWHLDVYWRCVLRQCAATLITLNETVISTGGCVLRQCAEKLITLNDTLMSIGGVYYINVQQHWSHWMTSWCLLEWMCTTSLCSNTDDVEWHLDVYWRVRTATMCSNTDHLEWHLDVYWRCVLRQCAATLITLNDNLMSIGGVYYVNVQQHWSPWMRPWCLLEVCTTSMCSNIDHLEW
jgi:metal-sulfur cluster biosynthetic enzyme